MALDEKNTSNFFSNLSVVKKSKGNIYTEKPVFCDNGNSLIVSSGQSLQLYNTSTGNHIKKIIECSAPIITLQLHPLQNSIVIAITEDGEVTAYNLKTTEIEYAIKLKFKPVFLNKQNIPKFNADQSKVEKFDWEKLSLDSLSERKFLHAEVKAFQNNPTELFVWTTWCLNDEPETHLSVFTLNTGKHIRLFHCHQIGFQKINQNFSVATCQDYEVFVGMGLNFVYLCRYDLKKKFNSLRHLIGVGKVLTALAFHPTNCSFATGDSLGRIIIWENIFEKQPLRNILHWHALPVHDLYFSKLGNYLFSGGEENVLVKWSMISHNKDFLPRLSSTIHHISGSSENSLISVSTLDNKILILDFNLQLISTVQHFSKWAILKDGSRPSIFTIDPRSNCLVLNGKTGHIQFLSLKEEGKFIYTFDVTNRNFITSDSSTTIHNTEVTHARFSRNGQWLITVESRHESSCKECRLKFWAFVEKQSSFSLVSNVEFPHEDFGVKSLEISADDVVATVGGDKKFRLWSIFEFEQGAEKRDYWALHAIGKYRNLTCNGIDFSKDASLVAVTFGPVLTIWEKEFAELKCTLSMPHRKDELKFCKFGSYELSHVVVTASDCQISGWNLITLSLMWTVPFNLSLLISDPFSIFMMAFSKTNSLIVFNPSSPAPNYKLKNITPSPIIAAHCAPHKNNKLNLFFLTSEQELFCLEDGEEIPEESSNEDVRHFSTPYSSQLAEVRNSSESNKKKAIPLNQNNKEPALSLLDSPSHTLPNPSLLCFDILKGLLVLSGNLSAGVSCAKEVKNNDVVKVNRVSKNFVNVDTNKEENKLLNVVKTIFV